MITLGILGGLAATIGIVRSVQLVATDGYRRVPTRTYPNMFDLR